MIDDDSLREHIYKENQNTALLLLASLLDYMRLNLRVEHLRTSRIVSLKVSLVSHPCHPYPNDSFISG